VSHRGESDLRSACGRTEKGAVLESRLQAPGVVPVQAESQSWDTSEVDFEGQGRYLRSRLRLVD
jgi:hypothetical protein